jgi:hypothetical protein
MLTSQYNSEGIWLSGRFNAATAEPFEPIEAQRRYFDGTERIEYEVEVNGRVIPIMIVVDQELINGTDNRVPLHIFCHGGGLVSSPPRKCT